MTDPSKPFEPLLLVERLERITGELEGYDILSWEPVRMYGLHKGDVFRVHHEDRIRHYIATSAGYRVDSRGRRSL